MKITTLGPTHNFAAVNPPDWLASSLTQLATSHPGIRVLTLFADDLPATSALARPETFNEALIQRQQAFTGIAQQHFGYDEPLRIFDNAVITQTLGLMTADARIPARTYFNLITRRKELAYRPADAQPLKNAVIMLPPRGMQPHEMLAECLHIPDPLIERCDGVNIQLAALGHEWGHVENRLRRPAILTLSEDERLADLHTQRFCLHAAAGSTAAFDLRFRRLHNFFSGLARADGESAAAVQHDYWHDLHMMGTQAHMKDEYAAMLEVKMRSCGLQHELPDCPGEFIHRALNGNDYPELQPRLTDHSLRVARLRTLLDWHDEPYKYKHSETLASKVISAGYQLIPGAFR